MAIKIRRGKYSDYDPSKLVSGELAVVLEGDPNSKTGRSLYVCFQPGTVKRIVDYDDLVDLLANASDTYVEKISDEYLSNINTATDSANKAASSATAASESATSAAGNANKAASEASTQAERAETALAGLGSAITSDKVKNNLTTTDAGYVLDARQGKVLNDKFGSYVPTANIVDNLTTASSSKVLSANQGKALADRMTTVETDINSPTAVTDPADKTVLLSGGSGIDYAKLADAIIARYNANGLINNVTTSTAAQGALDAAQGKALYDLISANKTDISSLNNDLAKRFTLLYSLENTYDGARSLSIDLSPYKMVLIVCKRQDTGADLVSFVIPVSIWGNVEVSHRIECDGYYRIVTISTTSIKWGTANGEYPTAFIVPIKIYGL